MNKEEIQNKQQELINRLVEQAYAEGFLDSQEGKDPVIDLSTYKEVSN